MVIRIFLFLWKRLLLAKVLMRGVPLFPYGEFTPQGHLIAGGAIPAPAPEPVPSDQINRTGARTEREAPAL